MSSGTSWREGFGRTAVEWAVLAGIFVLAGAAAGAVVRPEPSVQGVAGVAVVVAAAAGSGEEGAGPAIPPGAANGLGSPRLAGHVIDLTQPIRPQVRAAARSFLSETVTLKAADESLTATRAQLGAVIPVAHITEIVEAALTGDTPLRRILQRSAGSVHDLPILVDLDDQVALGRLIAFKNRFDRLVEPAKFDFVSGQPQPERPGRHIMLYRALAAIQDALEDGSTTIGLPVGTVKPPLTAAQVAQYDFSQVVGWFETQYSRLPEQETRNFNLRLAGSFVDGQIVQPGQELSLNAAVGERSEVRGFKVAPVIAQGELIDGIGGGTCQIASTTFAASFFAGLDLVRRRPHSRPSGYIYLGLDATVLYPTIDLVLRNPYDFPIAFRITVADGKVRVEVRGQHKIYQTTFIRDVYQVFPFQEQVIEMPDWPQGAEVLSQRGINGYRMKRHRLLCEGTACWRESAESHYPPTQQIIRRGTNPSIPLEGFELPKADPHPPYSADRHMMITELENELQVLRRD